MVSILGFNFGGSNKKVSPFVEAGVSSTVVQSGYIVDRERNPNLAGQKKYSYYEDLLANISVISSSVRLYADLMAKAEWKCEPIDDSEEAKKYADLLQGIIFDQQQSWESTVKSAGLFVFWGFALLEMTAKKRDDGTIGFQSIELRPCRTITRWDVTESGNVEHFIQTKPLTGQEIAIPRSKVVYLVDNLLTDSPEGAGMFRAMSETAARLKEIQVSEKIGVDRDMAGLPIGRAPLAALDQAVANGDITEEQKKAAIQGLEAMVTLVKKGERTGIILDSKTYDSVSDTSRNTSGVNQWDLSLLQSTTNSLDSVDKIIRRLNMELARISGTEILLLGSDGSGSLALSKDKSSSLMLRINGILKDVAGQMNRDAVNWIWELNAFPPEMKPTLTVSEVSQRDVEELAATVRELSTSGLTLNRDDDASRELFAMLGLTPLDPAKEVTPEENVF